MYAKGHSTFIYVIELGIFVYYINCYLNIIAYSLITFILHILCTLYKVSLRYSIHLYALLYISIGVLRFTICAWATKRYLTNLSRQLKFVGL